MGILLQASAAVQRITAADASAINAQNFGSAFGSAAGLPTGRRSRESLLGLYRANPWVRLAGDVVAGRQSAAEWFLLLPKGARGQRAARRVRRSVPWKRAELVDRSLHDDELQEVDDHPFLEMMRLGLRDAPFGLDLNGHEVDKLERLTVDLMGEFYYALIRDSRLGFPTRWWPLPPTWVRKPQRGQPDFELTHGAGGRIPVEDMAYFRQPRPDAPLDNGTGVAESLDHKIQRSESADQYTNALLRNHASPNLLISGPGLGKVEEERFEEKWRTATAGPLRAGMAFFMGYPAPAAGSGRSGVSVEQLSHSPSDMDLEVASKNDRDAILQVWRVPPDVVGITEKGSNRATSHAAEQFMRDNRTVPDLESRRNWLQNRFFEPFQGGKAEYEGGWILDYRLPDLVNPEDQIDVIKSIPWAFSQAQIQAAAGVDAVEGSEERWGVPDAVQIVNDLDNMPDRLAEFP